MSENTALARFELALQSNEVAQTFQTSSFKMNVSREIQFALQHLQKSEYLQGATPESVKNAIVNVALTGLSLNPVLNQAYLVPRRVKNVLVAVLDPSYQGLITKMVDFGVAKKVVAQVVHENDQFDFDESTDSMIVPHKKYYMMGHDVPGKEIGAYAGIQTPQGDWQYKFLPIHRINQIMETSESYKAGIKNNQSSIWTGVHREEMIKKTAVKYLWKYLPKSEQIEAVGRIIEESNFAHETTDTTYTADDKTVKVTDAAKSKNVVNNAMGSINPPQSRSQKKEEATPAKLVVDAALLEKFELLLNDEYGIEMGTVRTEVQVQEITAAFNELGIDITILDGHLAAKSKAYKTTQALFERGINDHILMAIKALL